jgi:putative heme iron utilization protein
VTDPPSHAALARRLVQRARRAALATFALDPPGFPYTSLVAVADDGAGRPLLLLSTLAEHTRHLQQRPEASLLIHDEEAGGDPLAAGRVTLLGRCVPVEEGEALDSKRRFLDAHPEAKIYADFADFRPYRLTPVALRYVGGFGRMSWIDAAAYLMHEPLAPP